MLIILAPELDLLWIVWTSSYLCIFHSVDISIYNTCIFNSSKKLFSFTISICCTSFYFPINLHKICRSSTRAISICYLAAWETWSIINCMEYVLWLYKIVKDMHNRWFLHLYVRAPSPLFKTGWQKLNHLNNCISVSHACFFVQCHLTFTLVL